MQRVMVVAGLLGIWLLWFGSPVSRAWAEEVAIEYEVLGTIEGTETITWTLKLELRNLSGKDLNNLSVGLFTPFTTDLGEQTVSVGILSAAAPQVLTIDFTVPYDLLPLSDNGDGAMWFFVEYETAGGIPRSDILQGQPMLLLGEGAP